MALHLHHSASGAHDVISTLPCTGVSFHAHLSSADHPPRLCRAEPSDAQNTMGNCGVWCQETLQTLQCFLQKLSGLPLIFSCNTAIIQLILNSCLSSPFPTCVLFVSQHATLQPQVTLACFEFFKHVPTPGSLHLFFLCLDSLPLTPLLRNRPLYKKI